MAETVTNIAAVALLAAALISAALATIAEKQRSMALRPVPVKVRTGRPNRD